MTQRVPPTSVVHLVRHAEVHNPDGIFYGRMPGFHLSEQGRATVSKLVDALAGRDVAVVVASPLQRAQETAIEVADAHGLAVRTDHRVTEAWSVFEGKQLQLHDSILRRPSMWRHLWNPLVPSWGEPNRRVADRMWEVVLELDELANGREAVVVSHQLPVWLARRRAERKWLVHNPRRRRCAPGSVTSVRMVGHRPVQVDYLEPSSLPWADDQPLRR